MGQLPITSRLKRAAFQLGSVAKQTTDPTPNASVTVQGKDTVVKNTKTITTPGSVKASDDQCKPGDTRASCIALSKMSKEEIQAAEVARGDRVLPSTSQITTESTEKGEDVTADTYSKREGEVQTNFDGRQIGRATKFKNRYVRQSQNKLARADDRMAKFQKKYMVAGVDADGKPTSTFNAPKAGDKGYKKYKRLEAKQTENTNELADFKAGAANQAEAVRSGKSIGSTTRRDVDRQDTAGDQSPEQRLAQVKAEKRAEAATEGGITTSNSQSAGAITSTTPATGGPKDQFNVGELDVTKFGEYTATSSPNNKRGYGMKAKSVATKKLQGAQGKLPSHLQAAIKAAPERTALKKSYFKNK
jgi:hypothetical protein